MAALGGLFGIINDYETDFWVHDVSDNRLVGDFFKMVASMDEANLNKNFVVTADVGDQAASTGANGNPDVTKKMWANVLGKSEQIVSTISALKHVANVRLLFLPFKRVSAEGQHIPSATVAVAVTKVISSEKVDAVQATKNGWQIYMFRVRRIKLNFRLQGFSWLASTSLSMLLMVKAPIPLSN